MGYFLITSPENAVPEKSWVPPKTHGPGSPVKERGRRFYLPVLARWVNRDPLGDLVGARRRIERLRYLFEERGITLSLDASAMNRLMPVSSLSTFISIDAHGALSRELPLLIGSQMVTDRGMAHLYQFCNNNTLMWVDPDGEWVVGAIVAAGAVIALTVALPDWDADELSNAQATEVQRLIHALKQCASEARNPNVGSYLDAMTVAGVFESGKPDGDNDISETRNGRFFGYGNRTILSADFFSRGDVESQLQTLIHESYHAGTEDWTEDISYDYASTALADMKCCLKKAGVL